MPRVFCPDCGFDVVVDPSGRCPEGHTVVEPEAAAAPPPPPDTPRTAGAQGPSDLLRELQSLHDGTA